MSGGSNPRAAKLQFLSRKINQRKDKYGGSLENRGRLIRDIIDGVRIRCSNDFILGLRLSPERFDVELGDILAFTQTILSDGKIDFLDLSLWDVFKEPQQEKHAPSTDLEIHFFARPADHEKEFVQLKAIRIFESKFEEQFPCEELRKPIAIKLSYAH